MRNGRLEMVPVINGLEEIFLPLFVFFKVIPPSRYWDQEAKLVSSKGKSLAEDPEFQFPLMFYLAQLMNVRIREL